MNRKILRLSILLLVMCFTFTALVGCGGQKDVDIVAEQPDKAAESKALGEDEKLKDAAKPEQTGTKNNGEKKKLAVILWNQTPGDTSKDTLDGIQKALVEKGFVNDKNIDMKIYDLNSNYDNCPKIIEQVKADKPDVVIAYSALNLGQTLVKPLSETGLPLVMTSKAEVKELGLVESLEKPGKNVTGIKTLPDDLQKKGYAFLNKIAPINGKKAVFITAPAGVFNKDKTASALSDNKTEMKAYYEVKSFDDYKEKVLEAQNDPEVGWTLVGNWATVDKNGKSVNLNDIYIWDRNNLKKPHVTFWEGVVRPDMMAGLGIDYVEVGKQAAEIAVRILNGEKPGDIPVQDPRKLNIILNQKRASEMGIQFPADIMGSAYKIYTDYDGNFKKQQ